MQIKICKTCGIEIVPDNKGYLNGNKKYCSANCIQIAERLYGRNYSPKRRQGFRLAIFNMLGNKCIHCGFTDTRALQIDHINGKGCKELRSYSNTGSYYKHILDVGGIGYQLLCANCNWIKRAENKEYGGFS